jgi:choline dehydrogenase-like flavoprotein
MGLSFFETMRGQVVDEQGKSHPAEFSLKVEAASLSRLFTTGKARISGLLQARPWLEDCAVSGELWIDPLIHRRLLYDLQGTDSEGQRWRLYGQKSLSLGRPIYSMTHLKAGLWRGEEKVGEGMILFDLHDLPAFLKSFQLQSSVRRVDIGGGNNLNDPAPALLDDAQLRLVAALAEVLIAPTQTVPAADFKTFELLKRFLPALPPNLVDGFLACLTILDGLCRLVTRRRFEKLALSERQQFLKWLESWRPLGEGLVYILAMPIKAAHFSRSDYLSAIGYTIPATVLKDETPRYMERVSTASELPHYSSLDVDVVVVGTGAGGGPAAATLAEAGLAVAIVEEGHYHRRSSFGGAPEARLLKFWRDGGMTISIGNVPISIPTGKLVGGSTAINSGTSFRTPDSVLQEWLDAGFPDDFKPTRFARYLDKISAELQIAPGSREWLGEIASLVGRGADAMGLKHGALPRNAPDCDGQGQCAIGCPTDAKRSTNVSYIPRALQAGAHCFTGMKVRHVLFQGSRAAGVEAQGTDAAGAPRTLIIRARAVVLACGTLYSPLLLQDSGIRLPHTGKNLTIHPALGQFARYDHDLKPWNAIPQSYGIEGLVDPRLRYEGFYAPPSLSAPVVPLWGEALSHWMGAGGKVGQFGFMARDPASGSVRWGPYHRPLIRYDLHPNIVSLFTRGSSALAELLLRGGALEVLTGVGGAGVVHSIEEAKAMALRCYKATDFRAMGFHPLGTCRMAASEQSGVVDTNSKVFGTDNLYIMDGSIVPTSLGVNPQVTIMAMATRAAELLAQRL